MRSLSDRTKALAVNGPSASTSLPASTLPAANSAAAEPVEEKLPAAVARCEISVLAAVHSADSSLPPEALTGLGDGAVVTRARSVPAACFRFLPVAHFGFLQIAHSGFQAPEFPAFPSCGAAAAATVSLARCRLQAE